MQVFSHGFTSLPPSPTNNLKIDTFSVLFLRLYLTNGYWSCGFILNRRLPCVRSPSVTRDRLAGRFTRPHLQRQPTRLHSSPIFTLGSSVPLHSNAAFNTARARRSATEAGREADRRFRHVRGWNFRERESRMLFWNAEAPVHILNVDKYVEAEEQRPPLTAAAESGLSYKSTTVFTPFFELAQSKHSLRFLRGGENKKVSERTRRHSLADVSPGQRTDISCQKKKQINKKILKP